MSKLGLYARPIVLFDATNKVHRQWVVKFLKTGAWGDCPVRFAVNEDYGNLMGHIQRELLLYYADRDREIKAEPQRSVKVGTVGGFDLKT
jgi:hypothetical protein